MKNRFSYYLLFFIAGSLIINGCNTPTGPKKDDNTIQPPLNDTTSQNFTFETYLFGDGYQSSWSYDSWIFNKDNMLVTGYIGPEGIERGTNILKYDGVKWRRVEPFFNSNGIMNIWAQDSLHLYFASGGIITYINNVFEIPKINGEFTIYQGVQHIWGSSENNIWAVGRNGSIIHFNGTSWNKVDFDMQWSFYDITGSKTTGVAYAVARNNKQEVIIVKLFNGNTEIIFNSANQGNSYGVDGWTLVMPNENELYVAYGDIWKLNLKTGLTENIYKSNDDTFLGSSYAVASNDIYFYGFNSSHQILVHYNGKRFKKMQLPVPSDITRGIKATSAVAIAVGTYNNKASIIKITRGIKDI